MQFKFELGSAVEDVVCGFQGRVVGRTQYLTGCNVYGLSPLKKSSSGKRPDMEWIDEPRLFLLNMKPISIEINIHAKTGGPHHPSEFSPSSVNQPQRKRGQ